MRVVLVGYRGTGKSTVGQILARSLGWPFVDTDLQIEQRAGLAISEIFRRFDEPHFRDLEAAVIADLADTDPAVISAGGGAVLRPQNVEHLRNRSLVVWLTAPAETLHRRIIGDAASPARRPSLTGLPGLDEIRHLLDTREPCYRAAAHLALDTQDLSAEQIAQRIVEYLASPDRGASRRVGQDQ
jgi:shikimate kinase